MHIIILLLTLFVTACAHEVNYRGVSQRDWQKLSAEQKQLIVDQSYEEEVNGIK